MATTDLSVTLPVDERIRVVAGRAEAGARVTLIAPSVTVNLHDHSTSRMAGILREAADKLDGGRS